MTSHVPPLPEGLIPKLEIAFASGNRARIYAVIESYIVTLPSPDVMTWDTPVSTLFVPRITNVLQSIGIERMRDFERVKEQELLELSSIGPVTVGIIQRVLRLVRDAEEAKNTAKKNPY